MIKGSSITMKINQVIVISLNLGHINSITDQSSLDNGKKDKDMEEALNIGQMDQSMKDTGETVIKKK
jgi:hypothetical protein